MFRYYPGLFKIQIAHPTTSLNEDGEVPAEALLTEFVSQINKRLPAASRQAASTATASTSARP